MKSQLFNFLAGPAGWLFGHKNLVRCGQFLTRAGRLDYPNTMTENGEMQIQSIVIDGSDSRQTIVVDCGANIGDWTKSLCRKFRDSEEYKSLIVYCFEPSKYTFLKLKQNVGRCSKKGIKIHPVNMGLSSEIGQKLLTITNPGAGTNCIDGTFDEKLETSETIQTTTLDSFMETQDYSTITFLKIDAEGHDPKVLQGACNLIEGNKIEVIQFEYNWLWIQSGFYLKDVFKKLTAAKYNFGKITPKGVQFYAGYHYSLETFEEGNYLACTNKWRHRMPTVIWHNDPSH